MESTKQVNMRVPAEAHAVLLKVGARLRDDAAFLGLLEQWLAQSADAAAASLLSQRLDHLEQRLAALEEGRGAKRVPTATPAAAASIPSSAPPATPSLFGEPRKWTVGEGKGRRLTASGEAELVRRILAEESDQAIANALGVRPNTVKHRRARLGERPAEG